MLDALFIQRCLELASLGAGNVSPNPMVGAILVHEGKIIGEGWHQKWGEAHAEVNCLRSVSPENQALIPYSTLYCNLEPCSHHGKTPPCADLILEHKIPRVVIANLDPNPLVAGAGLARLRESGVEVLEGVLEEAGKWLNRVFFSWISQNRPYVILKWAQTRDGFLGKIGEQTAISGPVALRLLHRWRSACDAILVGTRTALIDNPRLDVRYYSGKNPVRIVLDTQGKIPESHHIMDDSIDTWIFGPDKALNKIPALSRTKYFPAEGMVATPRILEVLKEAGLASLLVEGGARVLNQFLEDEHWDEIRVIENKRYLGAGVQAPKLPKNAVLHTEFEVGADMVRIFVRNQAS